MLHHDKEIIVSPINFKQAVVATVKTAAEGFNKNLGLVSEKRGKEVDKYSITKLIILYLQLLHCSYR